MPWALSYASSYSFTSTSCTLLVILLLLLGLSSQSCNGLGTFGFDIHHRYSDTVKAILGADGLPEKGSVEYYAAMARRDRIIHGRHLAASNNQSPLTFANGNNAFTDLSILLARKGLGLNYFSVCFGPDHTHGRINFGDGGSLDQKETPFTMQSLPYYKIGFPQIPVDLTQITVGSSSSELELSAAFDSGTSLTILRDSAYTLITKSFASQFKEETRSGFQWGSFPLDYCYDSRNLNFPNISLTLKGGVEYFVIDPILPLVTNQGRYLYCLGISKGRDSDDNIIGQSFMTGYRLVFNHEKMAISWNKSDCGPSQSPTLGDNSNSPPQSPLAPNGNSDSPPPESPLAPNHNSNPPPEYPPAPNHNSNSPPESPPAPTPPESPPPQSPLAPNHNSNPPPEYPPAPNHNSNSPPESPPPQSPLVPNRNSNSPPEYPPPESSPAPNHNSNSLPTPPSQSPPSSAPLAAGSPGNDNDVPTTPRYMINHSPELKSFTCGLMMLLVSFFAIV